MAPKNPKKWIFPHLTAKTWLRLFSINMKNCLRGPSRPVFLRFSGFSTQYRENRKKLENHNNFSALIWYFHINVIFWYLHMVWLASSLYGNIYYCRTCFLQIFSDSRLNTPKMKKWRNRDNVSAFIWSSNVNLIFLLHA